MTPPPRRPLLTLTALMAALHLPFLGQPFHIDDSNFLALARGVLTDPWRPHDVVINWLGTPQRAFEVLSNPPGVAYVLALVTALGGQEFAAHLAMLPFTLLATWGMWMLARRFCQTPLWVTALFVVSPAVVVSAHLVMPDLPLLAFYLVGLAWAMRGVEAGHLGTALVGAVVLGAASLFRYSGLTGGPLLVLFLLLVRGRSTLSGPALLAVAMAWAAPPILWMLHDIDAYGSWHFAHMIAFQGQATEAAPATEQLLTQLLYVGGTLTAPLLPLLALALPGWPQRALAVGGLAAAVGCAALTGAGGSFALHAALFGSSALVLLGGGLSGLSGAGGWRAAAQGQGGSRADTLWLWAWAGGILFFNVFLRFVSARYLLLAAPPLLLLGARAWPRLRAAQWAPWALVAAGAVTALLLSSFEMKLAGAYKDVASRLAADPARLPTHFTGHWGLQYYLEAMGAQAFAEDTTLPAGALVLTPTLPWPQEIDAPMKPLARWTYGVPGPCLATISSAPVACFHSDAVARGAPLQAEVGRTPDSIEAAGGMCISYFAHPYSAEPTKLVPAPAEAAKSWLPWSAHLGDVSLESLTLWQVGEP